MVTTRSGHRVATGVLLAMLFLGQPLFAQKMDFGDAPAGYGTRLVDDGARHVLSGNTLRLGTNRDADSDGQPDAAALLDDANPPMAPDDEDGVTFHGDLVPGAPCSVAIDCQGIGGGTALLQGWIDGNTDGDWADPGEHVLVDVPLASGPNLLSFTVPTGLLPGGSTASYARFRVSSLPGLGSTGQAIDGEVEDYAIELCRVVWLQPPDLSASGVSVAMDNTVYDMSAFYVDGLADDYYGTKPGPITDIHLWASFQGDNTGLQETLLTTNSFRITIYTNYPPSNPPYYPHNMPYSGMPLWQGTFHPGEYQAHQVAHLPAGEWWLDPDAYGNHWYASGGDYCYQYDFHIASGNAPLPEMGAVYWLLVEVEGTEKEPLPGWKSSSGVHNFAAVWQFPLSAMPWWELVYDDGHPFATLPSPTNLIDLAFALGTEEANPEHKMHWPQLPDPHGWDVRGGNHAEQDMGRIVLADDFQCAGDGPITDITFWGSWIYDDVPVDTAHQEITNVHLAIHADIPDPDGEAGPDISRPDTPALWSRDVNPAAPPSGWVIQLPQEEASSLQGWLDPREPYWEQNNHRRFFRYHMSIPEVDAYTQTSGTVYWLSISVESMISAWGWKTSGFELYGGGAVWAEAPVGTPDEWKGLVDPVDGGALDLAFFIDSSPGPGADWGDLPEEYNTLAGDEGAFHNLVSGVHLGALIDADPDGQPSVLALGDDEDGTDDEDGIVLLTPLVSGEPASFQVSASVDGQLDVFLDVEHDGEWSESDRIFGESIPAGVSTQHIDNLPPETELGLSMMRFRFNTGEHVGPTGPAPDGEVEDYAIQVGLVDWGDAPDSPDGPGFNTRWANRGANHLLVGDLRMGGHADPEPDGLPTVSADGDDTHVLDPFSRRDDEDGVTLLAPLLLGRVAEAEVVVPSGEGWLAVWVDSAAKGAWSPVLHRVYNDAVSTVTNTIVFEVPVDVPPGPAYLRARLTSDRSAYVVMASDGGPPPYGPAADGEVEDYLITVYQPEPVTEVVITNFVVSSSNGTSQVSWTGEADVYYQLQETADITDSSGWIDVEDPTSTTSTHMPLNVIETTMLYRVTVPWVH